MSMINADENFEKLGLTLPPAPAPAGVYKPCVIDGKYLYLSGHGPVRNDKSLIIGRIGKDLTMDGGKDRKSTRLNSSHPHSSRMPSSA